MTTATEEARLKRNKRARQRRASMDNEKSSTMAEEKRLQRNKHARARYASMNAEKKSILLSRAKERKAISAKTKNALSEPQIISEPDNHTCSSVNLMDINKKSALISRLRHTTTLVESNYHPQMNSSARGASSSASSVSLRHFKKVARVRNSPWSLPSQKACKYCGAFRFYRECAGFCCAEGQIRLIGTTVCPILWSLFTQDMTERGYEFRRRVRSYNSSLAFTSIGMNFEPNSWWAKDGIYALKVFGQVCHIFKSVDGCPNLNDMLQLFFLDTAEDLNDDVLRSKELRPDILSLLIDALSSNPYAIFFKRMKSWNNLSHAHIVVRKDPGLDQTNCNLPTVEQVAAIWEDGAAHALCFERDIEVFTQSGHNRKIKYYYGCYDPLQYPLLCPRGEPGWQTGIKKMLKNKKLRRRGILHTCSGEVAVAPINAESADHILRIEQQVLEQNARKKGNVSCREYYCYKAQMRDGDCSYILHAGRLGHQYIIDMYIKLETSRLDYYRKEQTQQDLRTESYQGIVDTLCADGYTIASDVGQKVILPSSFIGGPRDMRKRYVNAMSLVQRFGKPDLFLTMTCNPAWEEIAANLLPGQKPHDRPDLTTRVFKAKLEELKHDIVKRQIFGPVAAYVYTVEYQKRGLPHCHWVIILQATHKIMSSQIYDEIISAEIPDNSHPFLKSYVVRHMMHGPCGVDNPKNSCMSKDKCKNHYPKDFSEITSNGENSYPSYRRRNDGKQVTVRNKPLDNRHVVPYSPFLLAKFDCHINVEICADVKLVKYLYKYIHKGHDKLAYQVIPAVSTECQDEIHAYQNGRWICAPEAYWRIYSFPMSDMHPAVIVLPVHLPNHQPLRFGKNQSLQQVLANPYSGITMLTEFFAMNASNKDAQRLNLLYKEFPEFFVWESTERHWKIRKKQVVIGRLCTVSPLEGERYFERLLLGNVRCPKSFNDLMTVGGKKFDTFREAAVSRGLLHSNKYVDTCLAEAALFQAPSCLRILFAMLLIYAVTSDLQVLWDKYYYSLSEDFASNARFTKKEVLEKTVDAIDMILTSMDKCIADFPIRFHVDYSVHIDRLSRDYRYESLMRVSEIDKASINQLNDEQQQVYNTIVARLHVGQGGVFFLDGPGGTGKTFLYRALLAYVRSRGNIALAVATSGVAASLLPGGRTAHSRFKLPLDVDDVCAARISKQTSLAKMITESKMIVWDEASMANKHTIEALHHLLCDLCDKVQPFGGKCVLFGGDFRQTLPIVTRGSRDSMIKASIVSSTLWPSVQKLHLTKNMRAQKDLPFTDFLLRIGNGNEPFLFDDNVQIPANMLIHFDNDVDSLNRLIDTVYPGLRTFKEDPHSLVSRAILTTKNDCVQELNDFLIEQFPGDLKEYVSFNATDDTFQQGEYEDYLNSLSASGLPPHILRLKRNCPIMLLRNLNPIQGLCNGTRLICREMGDNFIQAEIAVGDFKGDLVFIPRIPLESSDRLKCPIPFKRMQIPVKPCFVMTINKSQGQTLDFVGIYLREPVFSHGQLYVALSRARNADSVKILIHPDVKKKGPVNYTKNVVYHEIFDLAQGKILGEITANNMDSSECITG